MRSIRILLPAGAAALLLAGCSSLEERCAEPRLYQQAATGKKVEVPDGMDPLSADREMTIPKASPQAPKPPGVCMDMPPTLRTGDDDGESDAG